MEKMTISSGGITYELWEYVEDYYTMSKTVNPILKKLREGLPTWISKEQYKKMNVSLLVYNRETVNAFCHYDEDKNTIALSIGLIAALWNEAGEFINQEKLQILFNISESKKEQYKQTLFFYMLNFIIAHEFGHIAYGHLREKQGEYHIDETKYASDDSCDKRSCKENWVIQLKEYAADSFAASIQSILFLQCWSTDMKINCATFDILFIANYLCFRVFAERMGRNFDEYIEKSVEEYDHPHPGVRMHYTSIHYANWIGSNHGFGEDVINLLESGNHAVIAYEKRILEKNEFKESYFSIAITEKGVQHIKNLHNGWQDLIDYYNKYAYIPIEKNEKIDSIPFTLDERGNFINVKI